MHGAHPLDVPDVSGRPLAVIVFTAPICSPQTSRPSRLWGGRSIKKDSMFERFTSPASRIATPATSLHRSYEN